jgi:hypothetical protein
MSNHTNSPDETQPITFDQIKAMTDRELLAVFARTLRGCDWIYTLRDDVDTMRDSSKAMIDDDEYLTLLSEYWLLENALEVAEQRLDAGGDGHG